MNRLAVVAVQEEENQLLCVTKTEDSTGKVEADAEKQAINNWGLSEGIITTSSNSEINSGSCVLLQQLLNKQLLWLACRHHIPELILKAAFQSLFGKTTSPVETLFSTLKSSWKSLDLSNLSCPPTSACYRSSVDSILEFLDDRLLFDNLQHLTRGDYKELLELSKVCLGGTIERRRPTVTSYPALEQTTMPDGCLNASKSSNSPSYSIRSTPSPLRLRRRSTPWHPLSCLSTSSSESLLLP